MEYIKYNIELQSLNRVKSVWRLSKSSNYLIKEWDSATCVKCESGPSVSSAISNMISELALIEIEHTCLSSLIQASYRGIPNNISFEKMALYINRIGKMVV